MSENEKLKIILPNQKKSVVYKILHIFVYIVRDCVFSYLLEHISWTAGQ